MVAFGHAVFVVTLVFTFLSSCFIYIHFWIQVLRPWFCFQGPSIARTQLGSCSEMEVLLGRRVDCSIRALCIDPRGRWGNNILQVAKAARVAQHMGYDTVYIPKGLAFIDKHLMWENVNIVPVKASWHWMGRRCHSGRFWDTRSWPLPIVGQTLWPESFRAEYLKLVGAAGVVRGMLSIHVRGGDVFEGLRVSRRRKKEYGQPPCSFYFEVMKKANWSTAVVFSTDYNNPCVSLLAKRVSVRVGFGLRDDLKIMLESESFVCARGTFGSAFVSSSTAVKKIFTFGQRFPSLPENVNESLICTPTTQYQRNVLNKWYPTVKQLALMVESPACAKWVDGMPPL